MQGESPLKLYEKAAKFLPDIVLSVHRFYFKLFSLGFKQVGIVEEPWKEICRTNPN